ncbi:MAG: acetate/propionate family kinase [Proteobacteria bacterium]|nr:acetate/propionate family kinase [Pseudomonadota bacterium]
MPNILTINAGSSSIKYKAYHIVDNKEMLLLGGIIEGIGEQISSWRHQEDTKKTVFKNHKEAFKELADRLNKELKNYPIEGIGHRVVHGGEHYYLPTRIDDKVLHDIEELAHLAPIHNPINAEGIKAALLYFKDAVQIAIFDSGFHHSLPPYASHYALNFELANRYQIKRYGFHGINHEYVARQAALHLNKPFEECNLISLHLGNGASACLVKKGLSYDTSMGMTPLAGLVMGTRCGDIDPAIVIYLQKEGMSSQEVDELLNKKSGLLGMANNNDMRQVLAKVEEGDKKAALAINIYVYSIQKIIGAYLSQITRLDALIFTGGVGENASLIREKVLQNLSHFNLHLDKEVNLGRNENACYAISNKGYPIFVIKGDEEKFMAAQVAHFLERENA